MFRIGAPDLELSASEGTWAGAGGGSGAGRSGRVGRSFGRLLVWSVLTVAVTLLLRPNTGRSRSLFFGSGPAAEMFNKIFGLSSVPEVVKKGPGITMVARGPARRPAASHPVKKLELAPAPEVGAVAVARTAPVAAIPAPTPAPVPSPSPETNEPAKASEAVTEGVPVAQAPAQKPAGAKPHAAGAKPHAAGVKHPMSHAVAPAVAVKLGPKYLDDMNGYSIHFPLGWRSKASDGGRWVVDATDGSGDMISLGFRSSKVPLKVDAYNREAITRGLKTRPEIFVLGDGVTTLGGRPCLWHKYTGPVARRQSAGRRMTVIHFRMPLENGRLMELRVATAPEKFQQLAPSLKQSIDTLRFVTPQARAR